MLGTMPFNSTQPQSRQMRVTIDTVYAHRVLCIFVSQSVRLSFMSFFKSIGLWIIQRTFLMNYGVMLSEIVDDCIQKMTSLIVDKLNRATEMAPNVLV